MVSDGSTTVSGSHELAGKRANRCVPQLLREYRPPLFSAFKILCFPLPVLTQIHAREGFWKGSFWPLICRGELRKRMIMTAHHVQSWDKP